MLKHLYRLLDLWSEIGVGKDALDLLAERRWWRIVFHHEAGHAVAKAALFGAYNDLTAENWPDGNEIPAILKKASYGEPPGFAEFDQSPLNHTLVLSSGAQAERVLFDADSLGYNVDRNHLGRLLRGSPGIPRPHLNEALEQAEQEITEGYPRTRELLVRHERALRAIGKESLRRFEQAKLLGKRFERRTILSADRVHTLFTSYPPKQG
jgi:hypothetical protein